jgi:CelD/BcsL family acetyltransferase involved in cellulose biosynthesis
MPTIEIVEGGKIFESIADEWDHLFQESPFASPFQSRQWLNHWSSTFSKGNNLRTIILREGSDIVGIYPLVQSFSPWRALRPAGVGPSDYLAPIVAGATKDVFDSIQSALLDLSKSHLIDLHQIPSDHPFIAGFTKDQLIDQAKCLVLDLPNNYSEYVASLSKSLRYDVRRLEGKALKERGAVVDWVTNESASEFADQFFELHKARWKSRGLPGAFFGKNELFQRNWMIEGVRAGVVIMNRLTCEGRSVGSVYAMRHGTTCYFYQAGMDPSASSLSPGTILVSKMIERAIDLGCTTFDFMRGDEPYKRRWKPNRERTNSRILMPQQNVLGKTGMWWNNTAWRVELKVRERLEGKSLRPSKAPNQDS